MQRIKRNRRTIVDWTVEALLVSLCAAASIYGLTQLNAALVTF